MQRTTPTICLNMIVKNEAHIVHEVLESVAPHIDYWVIVDTGSDDGTQDIIRSHMAASAIPGELHERPWRDFGHNRTEALNLAQGHCDYIWVMDADDTVVGTIDFSDLSADGYFLQMRIGGTIFLRLALLRDGLPWRFEGVIHEQAVCDDPATHAILEGDYYISARTLGGRSLDGRKYERDLEVLLAEVERNPDDTRSVFYLARNYAILNDYAKALTWFRRRVEMGGGFDEEIYHSLYRIAEMMDYLDEPWAQVQDAYLRAWAQRPGRVEPLHAVAYHYRSAGEYELGYLFAARAGQVPLPQYEHLLIEGDMYRWRSLDEQAVCASWIDRPGEAAAIWRGLLKRDDIPESDYERIRANYAMAVPRLLDSCAVYPPDLAARTPGRVESEVTVTIAAGPDIAVTEGTLNSFLRCCTDSALAGRFLLIDTGLGPAGRATIAERYPFVEFIKAADLAAVRAQIGGRYWLHLWEGWRFFAEERLITRLRAVLEAEPHVYQVAVNLGDAHDIGGEPARVALPEIPGIGHYTLTDTAAMGPALFDVARLDRALRGESAATGATATLDDVFCVAT